MKKRVDLLKVNIHVNREKITSVCEIFNKNIFEKMQMHERFQTFGQFIDNFAIMSSIINLSVSNFYTNRSVLMECLTWIQHLILVIYGLCHYNAGLKSHL